MLSEQILKVCCNTFLITHKSGKLFDGQIIYHVMLKWLTLFIIDI